MLNCFIQLNIFFFNSAKSVAGKLQLVRVYNCRLIIFFFFINITIVEEVHIIKVLFLFYFKIVVLISLSLAFLWIRYIKFFKIRIPIIIFFSIIHVVVVGIL